MDYDSSMYYEFLVVNYRNGKLWASNSVLIKLNEVFASLPITLGASSNILQTAWIYQTVRFIEFTVIIFLIEFVEASNILRLSLVFSWLCK